MNRKTVVLELSPNRTGDWSIWIDDNGQRREHGKRLKTERAGLAEMHHIETNLYHHGEYKVIKRYEKKA